MSAPRPDRVTLMAYVDGQLASAHSAEVEQWCAQDPALAAEVAALQAQRQALRDALDPLLDEPVPARLLLRPAPPARHWAQAA